MALVSAESSAAQTALGLPETGAEGGRWRHVGAPSEAGPADNRLRAATIRPKRDRTSGGAACAGVKVSSPSSHTALEPERIARGVS